LFLTERAYTTADFKLGINLSAATISKNVGDSPEPATETNAMMALQFLFII
jgi:hypothetical protein